MNNGSQLNKESEVSIEQGDKESGVSTEQVVSAEQGSQMNKRPQLNDSS